MSHAEKRSFVFAIRDFPSGCGTHIDVSSSFNLPAEKEFKKPRTSEVAVKNLSISDHEPDGTCAKREPADQDHVVAAPTSYATSSHRQELKTASYATSSHRQAQEPRNSDYDPTPRERVLEVLRLFKQVYRQLDRDKLARRGGDFEATRRIDIKTLSVLESMGKQVNTEKRIGTVPGIEVGDVFQYKTELRVVGLHSKTMCGIDYMKIGDTRLATSIVASEGYGYNDTFNSGVMIYTGEGGNVISKEKKTEDQKLVKGNLALANSMRQKRQVRVIRGEERWDHKGKRYVYDGLYMVEEYWVEREVRGKTVYKFKLCRIPGQPPLT